MMILSPETAFFFREVKVCFILWTTSLLSSVSTCSGWKKSWISWVAFWEKKGVFRKHSKYVIRIWVFVLHDHKTRSPNDHNGREDRRAADDGWMEILPLLNVDDVNVCPSTIPHLWFYASGSMARNDIYNPPYFTVYTSFILKWNN